MNEGPPKPRRLLLVDDEPLVLDALSKALRPCRPRWEVVTARTVAGALAQLEGGGFDALITEGRTGPFDGGALLAATAERWPHLLRVVLAGGVGAADHLALTGLAHHFIPKPVPAAVLHARVEDALSARALLGAPQVQELLCRLGTLPALPSTFTELNALLQEPEASLDQVVAVVERDPFVCGGVLRAVNSAWFGLRTRVGSAREAVRLLGFKPVRALVLATSVFRGELPAIEPLRRQALERVAALPRLLRLLRAPELQELGSTGAILMDVGRLVLWLQVPQECQAIAREVAGGCDELEAERRHLGADHALLGAALLRLWSLPPELVDAVALHHAPRTELPAPSLAGLLALLRGLQALPLAGEAGRGPLEEEVRQLAVAFGAPGLEELLGCLPGAVEEAA